MKFKPGLLLCLIVYGTLFFVSGCGSSVQSLNVNLKCDDDCNESNAIVLRMYQLRNTEKFKSSSVETLVRNPEEVLGEDIIPNSKFEKTMTPGESVRMDNMQLKEGALYLGVIGDFHSPAKDGWKTVIPLNEDIEEINVLVHENFLSFTVN